MKLLKCVPFILCLAFFSCSSDEDQFDEFVGQWELSNFKWIDCEDSGTDNSVDFAVPAGGCFSEGCYSLNISDMNSMMFTYSEESDTEKESYPINFDYEMSSHSIIITDEEFEGRTVVTVVDNNLIISTLEDGCDTEYRMRKI